MLDENLPLYSIKLSKAGNPLISSIYLSENGSEPRLIYNLVKPDSSIPAAKGCYAIALSDPHSPGIIYADVLVKAKWTQPNNVSTLDALALNSAQSALVPMVPESFSIQLHNPDHHITVQQKLGTWSTTPYWNFEMPINSFRIPSSSLLDRTQNAPALSDGTPKLTFKWKRDGKISKDITCYLVGKNTDGKRGKEPDITVAFFKSGKGLTLYEPNLHRAEIEDPKGFEIVLLLSAVVIKDIFFNPTKETFNMLSTKDINSSPLSVHLPSLKPIMASQILNPSTPSLFPTGRRVKSEVDLETERLKKIVAAEEKLRREAKEEEERRTRDMLDAEERERRRREAEIEKETEKLRKLYGAAPVNSPHTSSVTEHRICKLTGKIIPTPLRVSPAVSSWLDTHRRTKSDTGL